jgi:hypothetical protein
MLKHKLKYSKIWKEKKTENIVTYGGGCCLTNNNGFWIWWLSFIVIFFRLQSIRTVHTLHFRATSTWRISMKHPGLIWMSPIRVESYDMIDDQSTSLSLNKAPIWDLRSEFYYCRTVAGLLILGALSDERTGLSFTTAAGTRQRSHLRSESRGICNYITVSDSRLPFSSPLRLAWSRWRYSAQPPSLFFINAFPEKTCVNSQATVWFSTFSSLVLERVETVHSLDRAATVNGWQARYLRNIQDLMSRYQRYPLIQLIPLPWILRQRYPPKRSCLSTAES